MNQADKINILLVDDRPENLLALEAIIEHEEYNLIKAFSGEEALKYLLKYQFAAILLDIQMPGIDGFATAKIIKAREKTKNIPILFITANNMDSEHIFTGYSIGAIDYILKPFDPIVLKAKVEGFVNIYKLNQQLIDQAKELEAAYQELSKTTSDLRVSKELANVISETSIDSMLIIDEEGSILQVNPAVEKMFLYDKGSLLGKSIVSLFHGEESLYYIQAILATIANVQSIFGNDNIKEVLVKRSDGTLFPAEIQMGKRYVQDRCIVACTIRDITKKKQDQEKIAHMAYHDSLTDLPNRRLFNHQLNLKLNEARRHNHPLAIMYLDMDRFKYINDSLGHIMGDRMLQEIAKRIVQKVPDTNLVARVGGDEFNILLPKTNREQALEIADEIIDSFKAPFFIDNYELFITTCIGISIFPFDGEDALVLMRNADAALYRAKEQGKNQYKVFHSGMNIQSYRTFIMQNDLRKAIKNEEFTLAFQPRIEIESGQMKGAEALLRWNHPSWGIISPTEFIPIAEETGQIVEIGNWVLRSVCKQMKTWQETGFTPIPISVNFSAQQFFQKDLVETIQQIITEMDVNPSLLEIEITESTIMGNESTVTKTLHQLRNMGLQISIDDFGTGYSSLSYLQRFPVNTLKIDRSFVKSISTDASSSNAVISTIILLSHSLNMTVVAEGVETEEQLNLLKQYKCEEAQGFLYSPPIRAGEFENFLTKTHINTPPHQTGIIYLDNKKANTENSRSIPVLEDVGQSQQILTAALNRTKQLYSISSREMDVFQLLVNGLSNKDISDQLFISEHTVKNHITRIFQKLNVSDRLQAMAKVYQTCIEEGEHLRA